MRHIRRRYAILATAAAVIVSAVAVSGSAEAATTKRSPIAGSVPLWARSANVAGKVASTQRVSFNVVLPLRDAAAAASLAANVSDPRSPQYGRYLTPSQFNSRFAPTAAQVAKISSYLRGQGFSVSGAAQGNQWVKASGSVGQINKAFGVTLRNYHYKGRTLKAPDRTVSVPSTLRPMIVGVTGLDDGALLRRPSNASAARTPVAPQTSKVGPKAKPAATMPARQACSTYWGQHTQKIPSAFGKTSAPTLICGYNPKQLRTAYGVNTTGLTGAGQTVAIIDAYASTTMKADANKYAKLYGDPQFGTTQYTEQVFKPFTQTAPDQCDEDGWNGEEAIDVEAVHAMATGAKILYVGAQDCGDGLDDAVNWVIQNNKASIVSSSWGGFGEAPDDPEVALESQMFLQAKAQGIGMYFSSGDDGDDTQVGVGSLPSPEPDFPASDANVTAVGGTSLAILSTSGYQFETGWGSNLADIDYTASTATYSPPLPGAFWGGAGGGVSTYVPQPVYQRTLVPAALATGNGTHAARRVVPDVAANADPFTGMNIGRTIGGAWDLEPWGGTSLACPLFAGVQALASQKRTVRIGFANPMLYGVPAAAFHDVVPPASQVIATVPDASVLILFNTDSSLTTAPGYDDVTGRGSPIAPKLIGYEQTPKYNPRPPTIGLAPKEPFPGPGIGVAFQGHVLTPA